MLQNSYDIAVFNYGRMAGKAGLASAEYEYSDRDREVYREGYRSGRMTRIKRMASFHPDDVAKVETVVVS